MGGKCENLSIAHDLGPEADPAPRGAIKKTIVCVSEGVPDLPEEAVGANRITRMDETSHPGSRTPRRRRRRRKHPRS